jgi:hypothetical protein
MIIQNKHSGYQAGIRRYCMGGGGFSPAPNADPYTSANRPNYVPFGTNGQYNQPIYQPQSQNYNTGNSMNVSQYGQQPQNFSSQTMQPAQQTSMFGGQMQGGGYGQFGMNNPYSPYSNSFLNIDQNINRGTITDKVGAYRDSLNRGFNDQQIQNQVTGLFGQQTQGDTNYLQTQARLPVPPALTNYGPSQAIVGRSSQMRSTPNVMRRADGGIASLVDNVE